MSVYTKALDVIGQGHEKEIRGQKGILQAQYQADADVKQAKQQNLQNILGAAQTIAGVATQIRADNRQKALDIQDAQRYEAAQVRLNNQDRREEEKYQANEKWKQYEYDLNKKTTDANIEIARQNLNIQTETHKVAMEQIDGVVEAAYNDPKHGPAMKKMALGGKSPASIAAAYNLALTKDATEFDQKNKKKATDISAGQLRISIKDQEFNQQKEAVEKADEIFTPYLQDLNHAQKVAENPAYAYVPKNETEEKIAKGQEPQYKTFTENTNKSGNAKKDFGDMTEALLGTRKVVITEEEATIMAEKIMTMPKSDPKRQLYEAKFAMMAYANKVSGMGQFSEQETKTLQSAVAGRNIMDVATWTDIMQDPSLEAIQKKLVAGMNVKENMIAFTKGQQNTIKESAGEAIAAFNTTGGFVYSSGTKQELAKLAADNPKDPEQVNAFMKMPIAQVAKIVQGKTGFDVNLSKDAIQKDAYAMNPNLMLANLKPPTFAPTGNSIIDSAIAGKHQQILNITNNLQKSPKILQEETEKRLSGQTVPDNSNKPNTGLTGHINQSTLLGCNGVPTFMTPFGKGQCEKIKQNTVGGTGTGQGENNAIITLGEGFNNLFGSAK